MYVVTDPETVDKTAIQMIARLAELHPEGREKKAFDKWMYFKGDTTNQIETAREGLSLAIKLSQRYEKQVNSFAEREPMKEMGPNKG